jgi:hypothetical protein
MPNWVGNRLEVEGDRAELATVIAAAQGKTCEHVDEPEAVDFAGVIPPGTLAT